MLSAENCVKKSKNTAKVLRTTWSVYARLQVHVNTVMKNAWKLHW